MSQLDEANEIIQNYAKKLNPASTGTIEVSSYAAQNYCDKYLKPKDELFDTYIEFYNWQMSIWKRYGAIHSHDGYQKFKELFKDELNGTKALDMVIDSLCQDSHQTHSGCLIKSVVVRIKKSLEDSQ